MKNIVVCCDGTGNEINENISNVLKLYRCLRKTGRTDPPQMVLSRCADGERTFRGAIGNAKSKDYRFNATSRNDATSGLSSFPCIPQSTSYASSRLIGAL